MIHNDAFGCEITTANAATVKPWNALMAAFLAHSATTPDHLEATLESDADLALAHACRGLFSLMLARRELYAPARAALDRAQTSITDRGAVSRERLFVAALAHWLEGRPSRAAERMDRILDVNPQDALAMKIGQSIRFMLGDQRGMRASTARLLPQYAADHPALGYLMGCHAFNLEEAGRYGKAERFGRRGLELAPDDAWGLHAVAHVYDMTARSTPGIHFIDANHSAWTHCNNFRYHIWWHLALLYLDCGATDRVLDLYDEQVRADPTDDYRDIANASSLLTRLEIENVDVGRRWDELADICEKRTDDGCLAFADLHYMLALGGGGRATGAHALLQRMHADAARSRSESDAVMRHPGVSVAKGLKAFREGHYRAAFTHLAGGRRDLQSIGGSHAQRDVFQRLTIEAGIRSGQTEPTLAIVRHRSRSRGYEDAYCKSRGQLLRTMRHNDRESSPAAHGN